MIIVPSPSFTLEWGVCLLTLGFCWWRYRGTSAPNVVRMLLKKLEVFLSPTRTKPEGYVNQREERYLHGIPSTKSELQPRRYGRKPDCLKKPAKDLNFYKATHGYVVQKPLSEEVDTDQVLCSICCHPQRKGKLNSERRAPSTDLRNCLDCDTRAPHNPWYIRCCAYFVFWWRKLFIGEQYFMVKLRDMMSDSKVNQAIEEAAQFELPMNAPPGTYEKLVTKHRNRTQRIVSGMRAKQASNPWFSYFVRLASWIIGKTLGRIYPQILVRNSQVEVLRKARESGHPIVYLPVHRSHVDYVLVSWILVACDIRAPLVAAGDNLNIPIFSLLMRSVGGFFIKRRLDCREGKRDIVYRAILHSYMTRTLTDNNDLEFFIEGGRTRTGKPCLPKGGLLSIVVDTLMANKVEDVLIVPVNFSYERLLDGNFIREQLGRPKVSESFASAALGLWNSLQAKFGNARIDFGEPFSLREFIHTYQLGKVSPLMSYPYSIDNQHLSIKGSDSPSISNSSSKSSICSFDIDSIEQRELVNNLAKHVIYDGQRCFSMMSTNAIAFLLLNKFRKGVSTKVLAKEIDLLIQEMLERGYDIAISGDTDEVIQHGLTVLGQTLVRQEMKHTVNGSEYFIRPVTILPNVIELAYYSNCVLPAYSLEAVVATGVSILSGAKRTEAESISIDENVLVATCLEICEILQHEFVFAPPCMQLEDAVRSTIKYMTKQNIFYRTETHDRDMVHVDTKNHLERITFLTNLLKPIVDTYYTAACVLKRLVSHESAEKQLQMDILTEIKNLVQQSKLAYSESLALDPVRNFIKLMLAWEVLDSYRYDRCTIYYLHDYFDTERTIDEVVRRIQRFRVL